MTPQEKKEQFITELTAKIEKMFDDGSLVNKYSTCDHYNWNRDEHAYMPIVAQRLRQKGYTVSSSIKWGVTDWIIAL